MNYKSILVTGGAGFIGTNLIKKLLSQKYDVVSIDNYKTGTLENHQIGCQYIWGDISIKNKFSDYGKFDAVFHLAAIARIQPSFDNPIKYFETNTKGTLNLVDYCSSNNIPLIYAGSSSHHGGRFKNPYTFTKDIGEDIIKLYQTHFNLKSSIARFYNVYGPHHLTEGSYTTLIGGWEKLYKEKKPLPIYGTGEKRRDFTHVDDIVDGLIKIMDKSAWGHVFEFGRGENYSVNEIADIFGGERIYLDDRPGETFETLCDNRLSKELLDWEPTKDVKEYIRSYLLKDI